MPDFNNKPATGGKDGIEMPDLVFTSKGSAQVLQEQAKMNDGAKLMGKLYRDDARAAADFERAILRVFQNPKKAQEEFNKGLVTLKKGLADGKLGAAEYEKQVERLTEAFEHVKESAGDFQGHSEQAFGPAAIAKLGGFLSALGGISAAIGLAKNEYASLIELQDKATAVKLDISQARNLMIRNMLGSSPDQIKSVLKSTTGLAGELKLPESVVAQAMADAMSANSGDATSAAFAVRLAGRYLPDQQGEIGEFAGALLDLQKASGNADPRVNFGLLSMIGQRSRVASPKSIAENAPKALIGAAGLAGATGAEGAAFYSALTSAAVDKTGAVSGSATIEFARSLGLTLPKQLRKAGDETLAAEFEQLTMGGKIARLQSDPALANRFLTMEGLSLGSGDAVAPLRQLLLDPNSVMARNYRENMAAMPGNAALGRLADDAISNFRLNPMESLAKATRTIDSLHEQTLSTFPDTLGEDQRKKIIDIIQANGNSNVGTRLRATIGQFRDGQVGTSVSDARDLFVEERNRLNAGYTAPSFGPGGGGTFYDPNAQESVKRLDKVIEGLNKLLEEQKKNTQAVKDQEIGLPAGNF